MKAARHFVTTKRHKHGKSVEQRALLRKAPVDVRGMNVAPDVVVVLTVVVTVVIDLVVVVAALVVVVVVVVSALAVVVVVVVSTPQREQSA